MLLLIAFSFNKLYFASLSFFPNLVSLNQPLHSIDKFLETDLAIIVGIHTWEQLFPEGFRLFAAATLKGLLQFLDSQGSTVVKVQVSEGDLEILPAQELFVLDCEVKELGVVNSAVTIWVQTVLDQGHKLVVVLRG